MSAISSTNTSQSIKTDYLNLLVTQLQNQNPLEPMDNQEMASQLAQLSQLEQAENHTQQLTGLNTGFQEMLLNIQRGQAVSLIGKEVTFDAFNADMQQIVTMKDKIEGVSFSSEGVVLSTSEYEMGLNAIKSITQ